MLFLDLQLCFRFGFRLRLCRFNDRLRVQDGLGIRKRRCTHVMLTTVDRLIVSIVDDKLRWVTYQDLPSDPVSCWRKEECGSVSDISCIVSLIIIIGLTFIAHPRKWDLRNHGCRLQSIHPLCSGYRTTISFYASVFTYPGAMTLLLTPLGPSSTAKA
jgi:hypothetical protein